ncbi:MAG: SPFH domain-containing protein [Paracoccaceae bacterium]
MKSIDERHPVSVTGYVVATVLVFVNFIALPMLLTERAVIVPLLVLILSGISLTGFYLIQPNTAKVLTFLGNYVGTDKSWGLRWTIPIFVGRQSVSLRLRNFESTQSKVNDATGNPIEIAGVIVWRVTRPASSVFGVDNAVEFVAMQGEAAIRGLASSYPYGGARDKELGGLTLLGHPTEIAEALKQTLQARVEEAGVEIVEARLTHLAYAPEVASAMLQRQQADALLDAREAIVEGAVGLVETALRQLETREIDQLNDDQRAALASNLMVVLSGDQKAQIVIPAGT